MKSVFAYVRVSTVRQGTHGSSLSEQQSAIERYATKHNLNIVEWFEEQETAAKRGRPIFSRMLKLLERQKATGVIIHKIDRSARNLKDWADLAELIDRGVEIHFAHESLDLQSRGGRLAADIQAVVAADFVRNLRDEVKKGMRGRLNQGLYPLPAPIGYLDQGGGKAKTLDPLRAPLVRRLFERYACGKFSLELLREEAVRIGLTARNGGAISLNGLSVMLNNPFYMGVIRIKRSKESFAGIHEPIIAPGLFHAVQAVLHGRKAHQNLKHDLSYRKRIECASCGYHIIGERQKSWVYYRCHKKTCRSNSIREDVLDVQMGLALQSVKLSPRDIDVVETEFERLAGRATSNREELIQAARLSLGQVEERLSRLTDAFLDGAVERDHYLSRKEQLLTERIEKANRLESLVLGLSPSTKRAQKFLELQLRINESENTWYRAELIDIVKSTK